MRPDSGSPSGNERLTHKDYLPKGIHKLRLQYQKIKNLPEKFGKMSSGIRGSFIRRAMKNGVRSLNRTPNVS